MQPMPRDRRWLFLAVFARSLATGLIGVLLGVHLAALDLPASTVGLVVGLGLAHHLLAVAFALPLTAAWIATTARNGRRLGGFVAGMAPRELPVAPDVDVGDGHSLPGRPFANRLGRGTGHGLALVYDDADALDAHGRDRTHL